MSLENLLENLDNVTIRQKILQKSRSNDSININSSLDTSNSETNIRSLDLSTDQNTGYIEEMKNEIAELRLQLDITRNELDNIIVENNELKRTILRQGQQMDILKNICNSPTKIQKKHSQLTRKNSRHSLIDNYRHSLCETETDLRQKMNALSTSSKESCEQKKIFENKQLGNNIITELNDIPERGQEKPLERNAVTPKTHATINICSKDKTNRSELQICNQKKVYIFGGKQCQHLSVNLIKTRINTRYEKYQFMSFIKPGASTEEIIKTTKSCEFSESDRLILSIGEHDSNPAKVMIELSSFLKNTHCHVFILSIRNNIYLNEKKLNDSLKLICQQFKNCSFVDLSKYIINKDSEFNGKSHINILPICKSINVALDQFEYDKKFLSSSSTKKRWLKTNNPQSTCLHSTAKKGTIPYYFSVIEKNFKTQFFR